MQNDEEIWKDVVGYEGHYQVSSLGRIKSFKNGGCILKKLQINKRKYCTIVLSLSSKLKTRNIHQLVAEAFLGHVPCGLKLVVNHINYNSLDNRVENLEIITQRENSNKKHIKSTSKYTGVGWAKEKNKWVSRIVINKIDTHLGYFDTEPKASECYENALKCIEENRIHDIFNNRKQRTSIYKNVAKHKNGKYYAGFVKKGKAFWLGYFINEIDAHNAVQTKLSELKK